MFLVFSFKDISDTILSLVRIFILFFIFIYLPFAFLGAVWNVATSGSWYLVLGLVLAVAAFVYTTLKKQAAVSTVIGIACLALVRELLRRGLAYDAPLSDGAEVKEELREDGDDEANSGDGEDDEASDVADADPPDEAWAPPEP